MKTESDIKTAADAIAASIAQDRVVSTCLSMDEADNLGLESEDCHSATAPNYTEYWGIAEDGNLWKVRDYEKEQA